ncbi:MAG TPA: hypothetical protein VFP43_22555 [Mesorhizobium sp.]|nr:hypothetical protein [Mesorhizobium sp.]
MKKFVPLTLQANRIREGQYGSDERYGLAGAFRLAAPNGTLMMVISSGPDTESGWEHVSASCEKRCPTWNEMCWVKDQFWDEHEMAVQYHPPKSDYVNYHPFVLHIWRPMNMTIPMPPVLLVGPKLA